MATRNNKPADITDRTMFDLQTTRGWIETVGVAVGVIGAVVTIYFQLFPAKPPLDTDHKTVAHPGINIPGTVTQTGTVNVIGSGNTVYVINYTVPQEENRWKKREAELRAEIKLITKNTAEDRTALEQELKTVRSKRAYVEKSHEDRVAELKRIAGELEKFRKDVPETKINQALGALAKGDTGVADGIFAEVGAASQPNIETAARAAYERGRIAYDEVRWQDARIHFQRADRLSPDHEDYTFWAAYLAQRLGDYSSAGRRYEAIQAHVRSAKGEDAPETATALNDLAGNYESQGRYQEAEPLYKRAIGIDEHGLPAGHPDLARDYNNLALLYWKQGRYQEAEPLYKRAMGIEEKALRAGHPDIAVVINNLALLYRTQGRYQEAEPLYKRAIRIDEKALPAGHPDLARDYNNLAVLYEKQGRYQEAEPLHKKAHEIYEQALPAGHPTLAIGHNNLAVLYEKQGRYQEAERHYKNALGILSAKLGKQHPNTRIIADNFAIFLGKIDRNSEADILRKDYGL